MDPIQVPLWAWGATVAGLILLVAADLILGARRAREERLPDRGIDVKLCRAGGFEVPSRQRTANR